MPLLITPPAGEPVSPAELKAWLRLTYDDEDALLPDLLAAARGRIEGELGLSLLTTGWRDTLTPAGAPVLLSRGPVVGVDAVHDAVGATVAGWSLDPRGRFVLPALSPSPVTVDWRAGFGATPADVPRPLRQAVLALAADAFERRADPGALTPAGLGPAERWVASYRRGRL